LFLFLPFLVSTLFFIALSHFSFPPYTVPHSPFHLLFVLISFSLFSV
jgi:hypothetical protein